MMKEQNNQKSTESGRLPEIDNQRAKTVEKICIGIVAKNIGYANQTLVLNAGRELFEYISQMTYKEFREIKKLPNNGNKIKKPE